MLRGTGNTQMSCNYIVSWELPVRLEKVVKGASHEVPVRFSIATTAHRVLLHPIHLGDHIVCVVAPRRPPSGRD